MKLKSLDIYRLLAMLLVMWGHIIGTGGKAFEIPGVIEGAMDRPILASIEGRINILEQILYSRLHIQVAVLGVVMFFMATGYLIVPMMRRYTRKEFLVNRVFRIYPTLIASTILWGGVVFLSQRSVFQLKQYLAIFTQTWQLFIIGPFMGVLWTLIIEILFYIIAAIAGRIEKGTVLLLYTVLILAGIFYYEFRMPWTYYFFYDLRYCGFILLGASIYLAEHDENADTAIKICLTGLPFLLNLIIFQVNRALLGDETT